MKILSVVFADDCGICENETFGSGIIASPNFPNPYGPSVDCNYTIRVKGNDTNNKIELRFDSLILEDQIDWIRVSVIRSNKQSMNNKKVK